jgi:hypothetical protein
MPGPTQPSPNSVPIPARLSQWSNNWVVCRNCCVRARKTSASETCAFPCSAARPRAHPRRRTARHQGQRRLPRQVGLLWGGSAQGRIGAGRHGPRRCRHRLQEADAAALGRRKRMERPRLRNGRYGRAARRRRGRVHPGLQRVRCAAPRRPQADRHRPLAGGVLWRPVSCRNTAEQVARQSGAYAAAVAQARGHAGMRLRYLSCTHSFSTFSRRHRTPRPHYCSCALAPARPSAEHDAPDWPLLSAHSCACAAVPLRHAQPGRTNTFRGHAPVTSRCTANAPFPPTHLDFTLGVAGPTSHGGDEGGAFPGRARRGGRWRPRMHTGVSVASEPPTARAPFWVLFVPGSDLRAFAAVLKKRRRGPKIGCAQLAAIKRDATAAALVADVTAKNLDASTVALLRSVKVRCRRCIPLSVLGRRSTPRHAPYAGVLEYPWSTMSTHAARTSTTELHWSAPQRGGGRIACHAAAVATLERRCPKAPLSTLSTAEHF